MTRVKESDAAMPNIKVASPHHHLWPPLFWQRKLPLLRSRCIRVIILYIARECSHPTHPPTCQALEAWCTCKGSQLRDIRSPSAQSDLQQFFIENSACIIVLLCDTVH